MATITWWILGTSAATPNWFGNLQEGGSAPTAATTSYGYIPSTTALTTPFWRSREGATAAAPASAALASSWIASTSGPTKGTNNTNTTAGDSFITPNSYSGVFANSAWTFNWVFRATIIGAVGQVNMRVWASVNADGTSARELTSGAVSGSIISLNALNTDFNSSISWSPGLITLNNEFLFFQPEWQETTVGASGSTVRPRAGFSTINSNIVSSDFVSSTWWLRSEDPVRRIIWPVRLDETPAPTAVVAPPAAPSIGWLAAEEPTRRIVGPARLERVAEPVSFSTGVHHRWLDDEAPARRIVRPSRLESVAEPILFSTGIHHRWLDDDTPAPRRRRVSISDSIAWVPFTASAPSIPYGWFPSDQHVIRRKHARRLDEITVPLGETLPSIPVAPPWFMQSEQPQAPKARWIANVGPCLWTVVFPVTPPPSLPAVPESFVSGNRMIGWY